MRSWRVLGLLSSLPVAAGIVLTRGYPRTSYDAGIFLSVAGRLLAGDRLYRDVFDNKDPLFYFSQAGALWALGWRGPFLLDIGWVLLASIGSHLFVRAVTGNFALAVFAQIAYPLLLTGLYYNAGYSETPGLSLLPLLAYLVYKRRPTLAGCVAAVVLLLKVNLLPVVAAIGLAGLAFPAGTNRARVRGLLVWAGATAAAVSVIFLGLAVRGEAGPYVRTLRENETYASYALTVGHLPGGVRGHLDVVRQYMHPLVWAIILAIAALLVGAALAGGSERRQLLRSPLTSLTVAGSAGTAVTLAVTALYDHHLEVLAFPVLCASTLALESTRTIVGARVGQLAARATVVFLACLCLVALFALRQPSVRTVRLWAAAPEKLVSRGLTRAAEEMNEARSAVPYFHLGSNDEMGQGAFLSTPFHLTCPRFHQYPFTPASALRGTNRCLERTHPRLIAVTPSFQENRGDPPAWIQFVLSATSYVHGHCRSALVEPEVRIYRCARPPAS